MCPADQVVHHVLIVLKGHVGHARHIELDFFKILLVPLTTQFKHIVLLSISYFFLLAFFLLLHQWPICA